MVNASGGARRQNTDPKYLAANDPGVVSSAWVGYQNINEFTRESYEQFVKPVIGEYKTAIVMFSRSGAEGASPSMDIDNTGSTLNRTILELGDNEFALLEFAKENFDKTIVLLNTAAPMECGFFNEAKYRVDACLWMGMPGEAGIMGTANIVAGKSPSGALADTYAYDMSTNPTYYNMDNNEYANPELKSETGGATYAVKRESDANTALNAMDDVTAGDGNMVDGYLSRSNFVEGMASIMSHQSNETPNELLAEEISRILLLTGKESAQYTFETYIGGVKQQITKTYYAHGNDVAPYMTTTPDGKSVDDESYKVEWGNVYYVEEDDEGNVVSNDDGTFEVYENPADIASGKYHKLSVDDMGLVPASSDIWDKLASMTTLE